MRLSWPPETSGQHLLEVDVAGEGVVTLLADPVGAATEEGQPLHVRPVTRPQMASLLAMIERLDEPSNTQPPPGALELGNVDPATADSTIIDQPTGTGEGMPPLSAFGLFDGELPGPAPPVESLVVPRVQKPASAPPSSAVPSPRALPADLLVGRVIAGKYELESTIGSGSTASVFRAMHLDLKRKVAVKILHEQKLGQMQFVKRFKGEALAASKLEHPNVARVIDFGQEPDGLLYLVMELLTGRSLEAILAAEGRLPPRTALAFAIQACSALAFAHDVGIVHRDVKPENIMIVAHRDDDGHPCDLAKVCDFGLAKLGNPEPEQEDLTTGGMLCGSPMYMSPEQSRGETLDGRTDIYALGVTLFQALTGSFPHDANDIGELFTMKMTQPPRRLSTLLPDVDPLLEDVVLRALSADPKSRHANARVMREELREALALLEDDDDDDREPTIVAE
ncbi:MAG: Serine/threonine protein kinase PrkC, regulator of stationary phase [Labilithrix sp.]|nr:Serine/threonine protein kinase PrkC, regulator of stationary phase [Labilithrix sp.]